MLGKQPKRKSRPGVDRAGRTPLHYAASDGNPARVRELLDSGLDAGAADDEGWTPLHFAAQANAADAAELLLRAGSPVDAQDTHGNTPLFKAVFNSRGTGDVIKLFRAHGADPNAKNAHGVSSLKLARTIANFDVQQFFSDLPDVNDVEPGAPTVSGT